jgi:TnpA family transposase
LRLPRRKPGPKDPRLEPARQALARTLGDVQFPQVLIEIDGLTRFSWILLGRWSARIDPRRRTFAVGTYAHVLDQWGIFYDQPIVLNRRQAGAAIEGALRQRQVERIERVAVDTHGFTHFAMALAKLVGFDLCPRLAGLKTRRLYLPRGLEVPHVLRPIVAETVSRRAVGRGWEGLLRLGASVKHGWDSATAALDRFGSAALGDPIYNAGDALGRLLRSLYLCDYLSNPMFRTEDLDLLNQGEAVHSLQRAIHNGMINAKQGRTTEELGTISGALTLLANIVMPGTPIISKSCSTEHPAIIPTR